MSYPKKKSNLLKLKNCKHNSGKTRKAYGCGGNVQDAFKCDLHGLCIIEKVCKVPENVKICERCDQWELKQ